MDGVCNQMHISDIRFMRLVVNRKVFLYQTLVLNCDFIGAVAGRGHRGGR